MYKMITLATDNKVEVALDLTDAEFLVLFKMAHEADMTLNHYVEQALRQALTDEGFISRLKDKVSVGY